MDVVVSISKSCPLCTGITHLVYAMAICAKFRSFFFESDSSRFYQLDMSYFFFFYQNILCSTINLRGKILLGFVMCESIFSHAIFYIYSFYVLDILIFSFLFYQTICAHLLPSRLFLFSRVAYTLLECKMIFFFFID